SEAMQGEMLEFPATPDGQPTYGLALNLERDSVGAVILGEYEHISEGDTVKTTGRILEVPIGPELKGRVVNALGAPIDGKGPVNARLTAPIEKIAPGVIARQSVSQPMQTGLKAIDSMVPIGRRVSPGIAAAAPAAGPRGVSGRRVLSPLAPARARGAGQRRLRREVHQRRGQGQDRLADRAADHRDPGRRRLGVRADQRDLDH